MSYILHSVILISFIFFFLCWNVYFLFNARTASKFHPFVSDSFFFELNFSSRCKCIWKIKMIKSNKTLFCRKKHKHIDKLSLAVSLAVLIKIKYLGRKSQQAAREQRCIYTFFNLLRIFLLLHLKKRRRFLPTWLL